MFPELYPTDRLQHYAKQLLPAGSMCVVRDKAARNAEDTWTHRLQRQRAKDDSGFSARRCSQVRHEKQRGQENHEQVMTTQREHEEQSKRAPPYASEHLAWVSCAEGKLKSKRIISWDIGSLATEVRSRLYR